MRCFSDCRELAISAVARGVADGCLCAPQMHGPATTDAAAAAATVVDDLVVSAAAAAVITVVVVAVVVTAAAAAAASAVGVVIVGATAAAAAPAAAAPAAAAAASVAGINVALTVIVAVAGYTFLAFVVPLQHGRNGENSAKVMKSPQFLEQPCGSPMQSCFCMHAKRGRQQETSNLASKVNLFIFVANIEHRLLWAIAWNAVWGSILLAFFLR